MVNARARASPSAERRDFFMTRFLVKAGVLSPPDQIRDSSLATTRTILLVFFDNFSQM